MLERAEIQEVGKGGDAGVVTLAGPKQSSLLLLYTKKQEYWKFSFRGLPMHFNLGPRYLLCLSSGLWL